MLRGVTTFTCIRCGHHFIAPDIEYGATIMSMPQPCPRCGSIRTRPRGLVGWLYRSAYKSVWDRWEKETKNK